MWKDLFKHCVNEVRGIMNNKADVELSKYLIDKGCSGIKHAAKGISKITSDDKKLKKCAIMMCSVAVGTYLTTLVK